MHPAYGPGMNTYPPTFRGRGFGYGPMMDHIHQTDPALAWATFALILLLVLAFGAFLIATYAGRGRRGPGPRFGGRRPDALEVLRMRFASGQMTRDEFLQAAGDLTSTAPTIEPPPPAAA
jgi:uncharacterized membrane protein